MKKSVMYGMALFALVLVGISFVPTLFLEDGDRLAWQLSNWAWILASMLIATMGILSAIRFTKGKRVLWKIMGWSCSILLAVACLISLFITMAWHDEKIWSNEDYVVYSEYDGFIDPNMFVLYKRDGLVDRRMYYLNGIGFDELKEADYSMYNESDLIKEEIDATEFESSSVYHRTVFYRLSDGCQFKQEENDSLMKVIKH
ncbi:MAG: hypothetical protein IKH88_00810 [Prevotella sp.]|nr:hypothetical protein [Prevotella sp.]